jgi:hypothetical protein
VLRPKKKFNALPFLIGGGIFVGLAILIGLIVFAVNLMAERREAAAEKLRAAEEREKRLAAEKKAQAKAPKVEEELQALAAQEKEIQAAVSAYKGRLKDVLRQVRTATPDEMARLWTDLYVFCRDNGLATEGDQCWARAVLLRPSDPEVNSKLGRTESFSGVPVTPEQKQFLTNLEPRLVVVNLHPGLADHTARVNGQGDVPLTWAEPAELPAGAGQARVEIAPRAGAEGPTYALALDTAPGLVYTVHLEQPLGAPPPPFGPLRDIYSAVAERAARRGVTVERDSWNKPVSAHAENLRVDGLDEEPLVMQLSRSTGLLTIVGTVTYGNRYGQTGEHVLFGTADEPLRLAVDGSQETISLHSGGYYRLQVDLADSLWRALGVAQGDFASEWVRRNLAQHFEEVTTENTAMEADGKFDGPWQVLGRTYGRMDSRRREVEAELHLLNRAGQTPYYLDRARALRVEDRQEHLYMNWARFRLAMAAATSQARGVILGRLNEMAPAVEEEEEETGRPGAPARARPGAPRGPAGAMGGVGRSAAGPARQAARAPEERSGFEPRRVELSAADRRYARMKLLPMFADGVALQDVRDSWGELGHRGRLAAMVSLEQVATPEVVSFLGDLSRDTRDINLVAAAMLSLGVIGTPEALEYCDSPAIVPIVRVAAQAALATAGDPTVLDGLPQLLGKLDAEERAAFLTFTVEMDTPAALLVLSKAIDSYASSADRERIATALVRMGGHAAMSELRRLMEKAGVFPDLLGDVLAEDMVLLLKPVGRAVAQGNEDDEAIGFLTRNRSDAAILFLERAAKNQQSKKALLALTRLGSAKAIKAAAAGIQIVDLPLLQKIRGSWYSVARGKASWNSGVDQQAATEFIETLAEKTRDRKMKLATLVMLRELGREPSMEQLVALAEVAPQRARRATPEGGGEGPGGGGPGGGGPGGGGPGGGGPGGGGPGGGGPGGGAPGGPRGGQGSAEYSPAGYQDPRGAPLTPSGLRLSGRAELYALGLVAARADEQASAQLRKLADSYDAVSLRTAALRALGGIGGEENREFLRGKATARKSSYKGVDEFVAELQDRTIALGILGGAEDTDFLPKVLDILHETAPEQNAIAGVRDDYADLSAWWEVKLWTAACECLARMCRRKHLFELTADGQLQQQVVRRLVSLIDTPGPERDSLAAARRQLQVDAIVAFGRCASVRDEETWLIIDRLLLGIRAAGTADTDGPQGGPMAARASGTQRETGALRSALRNALTYMAVRTPDLSVLTREPSLLPGSRADNRWSEVMRDLGRAPTPEYFSLLNRYFSALTPPTREAILNMIRNQASINDMEYARFVARMLGTALPREEGERAAPEPERRSTTERPSGRRVALQREDRRYAARRRTVELQRTEPLRAATREEADQQDAAGTPLDDGRAGGPGFGGSPFGRAEDEEEDAYERVGPHSRRRWSYTISGLRGAGQTQETQRSLSQSFFAASGRAVAAALVAEGLLARLEICPAIAAWAAEKAPEVRQEVANSLQAVLIGDRASLSTKRAAVAALRRIGGQEGAQALFAALVGPAAQPMAAPSQPGGRLAVGPPGGVGPRGQAGPRGGPGGPRGPVGFPGLGGAAAGGPTREATRQTGRPDRTRLAFYIARALGSMGRDDLLRAALNAPGNAYFQSNPLAVQGAALMGMAYLPAERNPVQILSELLEAANTPALRRYAGEAVATALRHTAR